MGQAALKIDQQVPPSVGNYLSSYKLHVEDRRPNITALEPWVPFGVCIAYIITKDSEMLKNCKEQVESHLENFRQILLQIYGTYFHSCCP